MFQSQLCRCRPLVRPILFWLLGIAYIWLMPNTAQAQISPEVEQIPFVFNTTPPNRGTPPAGRGTGSRGDCLKTRQPLPLTPLVGSQGLEQTISSQPTFWIYVPHAPDEATRGEFSVQDGETEIYRTQFQLPETPGIISITLPSEKVQLDAEKNYRWYFDVSCHTRRSVRESSPASVTGMIRRVNVSQELTERLQQAKTPLQRVVGYAAHGLWFDTLTELANLRLAQPNDPAIQQAWVNLLSDRAIGFNFIANEPITGEVITSSQLE